MAWIDDRIWCHPKFTELTPAGSWLWVKSVAYSTGFGCQGTLTIGQQRTIGMQPKVKRELLTAGLWDELPEQAIYIHDWHLHNSKRDARRKYDKERKRAARAAESQGASLGLSAGQSADCPEERPRVRPGAEGSEGSEGSETVEKVRVLKPVLDGENPTHPGAYASSPEAQLAAIAELGSRIGWRVQP